MEVSEKRKKLGMTQKEIAKKMEVTERTIQNIEAGKSSTVNYIEYNRLLNRELMMERVRVFNDRVAKLNDTSIVITCDEKTENIFVSTSFKYFMINYNVLASRLFLMQKNEVISSWEEFDDEVKRVREIIEVLND